MNSSAEIVKALGRAEDALENTAHSLTGGFTLGAVNRAYYAMFYCMTALLLSENVQAKTHQGVRAKFGEVFIKTSLLPRILANYVRDAFDVRQDADYDLDADITEDEAQILVGNAQIFYQYAKNYLNQSANLS